MKKIYRITALLMLLPIVATSCFKLEEDDIFDKSAAERLTEMAGEYEDILTDKGGKWQMEYFANSEMQGFVYLMTFRKDGTVTISGENEYIGGVDLNNGKTEMKFGTADSQWDVITDNGPVLSFSTYNKYFHLFSRPDDFLNTSNGNGSNGYGLEGDYEFTLLKYSGDTLYIKGKKREMEMLMTRLPSDTDDKAYLDEVVASSGKYFSSIIPRAFLTLPNGKRYVITGGSSLNMTIYDEFAEDILTSTFSSNGIIGHDSFGFMNPLTIDEYTVQHFTPREDGSLICFEDKTSTISAGDLAKDCFCDSLNMLRPKSQPSGDSPEAIAAACENVKAEKISDATKKTNYWEINQNLTTGAVKTAIEELNSQLPKRGSFKNFVSAVKFCYMGYPMQKYMLLVDIKVTQSSTLTCKFYYTPEFTGADQLKMNYIESDGQTTTQAYIDNYSGMMHLIEAVMGSYKLSAASLLAPNRMTLTSTAKADDVIIAEIKRW